MRAEVCLPGTMTDMNHSDAIARIDAPALRR
jgi:hypothetical protein